MAEHTRPVETEKHVEASPDVLPPPADPETNPEMAPDWPSHAKEELDKETEVLAKEQTKQSDIPEPEYPSMAKVIPIVAALYMAFFLVALVCLPLFHLCLCDPMSNQVLGPHHHRNRHPYHHRRLSLPRRRRLVR